MEFEQLCKRENWLDSSGLANAICEKILTGEITPPEKIILTGFTEISPQHQYLLDVCVKAGSSITIFEPEKIDNITHRISLTDEETELQTMARWAKSILHLYPDKTIGCIIPNLKKLRDRALQIFSDVFSAEDTYTTDHILLPFNISAGKKLSAYPIIHTALQLLNIHPKPLSINTLSGLLRSPFLGEAEREISQRARFENTLRRNNVSNISLEKLMSEKSHFDFSRDCPAFASRIQKYLDTLPDTSQLLPTSTWVTIFDQQLTALGWPGERSLNSAEYQVVKNAWLTLLTEYAACDTVLGPLNYQQALHYLTYLATKVMFQPQSPEGAPIQLLGALEAADLSFDYLWVMGLDDTTWPPIPKPNPFIPQRLQKALQMPHATAERELVYCQRLTEQFTRSAKQIVFSHALHNDKAELRPSPIIATATTVTLEQILLADFAPPSQKIYATRTMEYIQDDIAPPIQANERISGGSHIFKLQAACPFKAFAELRLQAKKIDEPTLGLMAKDRGNIIHKAMEMVWSKLNDKTTLDQQDDEALMTIVTDSVEHALSLDTSNALKNTRYRKLESLRLQKLLLTWLEKEKARPHFTVIALEEKRETIIGNIPLTLRVDRIDKLDNGRQLIIDYKTGKNNSFDAWFSDRPDEPQLPLYCLTDPDKTIGILFAQINAEKMKWDGVSELTLDIDSVKTIDKVKYTDANNWKEQIAQWQTTLQKIGTDFSNGNATVDPKDSVETCRHCHLHAFCRIHESSEL